MRALLLFAGLAGSSALAAPTLSLSAGGLALTVDGANVAAGQALGQTAGPAFTLTADIGACQNGSLLGFSFTYPADYRITVARNAGTWPPGTTLSLQVTGRQRSDTAADCTFKTNGLSDNSAGMTVRVPAGAEALLFAGGGAVKADLQYVLDFQNTLPAPGAYTTFVTFTITDN